MLYSNRSWLKTDDHLPYLLFEAELPNLLSPKEAVRLLNARYRPVENAYGTAAFSLDPKCTAIFMIDESGGAALAILAHNAKPCDRKNGILSGLSRDLENYTRMIDDALDATGGKGIEIRSWKMEISRSVGG